VASAATNLREAQRPGNSWCFTCDGPPESHRPIRWAPAALAAAAAPPVRVATLLTAHVVVRGLLGGDGRIAFAAWPRAAWDAAAAGGWRLGPPEVSGDDLARAAPQLLPAPFAAALMQFRAQLVPQRRPLAGAVAIGRTRPL
jgi:hypothetical protein